MGDPVHACRGGGVVNEGVRALVISVLMAASTGLLLPSSSRRRIRGVIHGESMAKPRWLRVWERLGQRSWPGPAHRRRLAAERMRTVHGLSALSAELEAGQPPDTALRRCADDPVLWPRTLAALDVDADIPTALVLDGEDRPPLIQLAACWRVAAESGAGLATAVASLSMSARTAEDTRVALEAELAGPRSTARLLSALPLVGIGFGTMMGVNPSAWLLGTSPGRLCLGVAVVLIAVGMWWTGRIAAAVERLM